MKTCPIWVIPIIPIFRLHPPRHIQEPLVEPLFHPWRIQGFIMYVIEVVPRGDHVVAGPVIRVNGGGAAQAIGNNSIKLKIEQRL
jgi:hypothetical protein